MGNIGYHFRERARQVRSDSGQHRLLLAEALTWCSRAHKLKRQVSTPRRSALSKQEVAEIYQMMGRHDRARWWLRNARRMFLSEGLSTYVAEVDKRLALLND